MPPGWQRSARYCLPPREGSDRHEPAPRWVELLQSHGFDAVHWSSVGSANATDRTIMSHARTHGYIVLTHDLDFSAILAATGEDKPSVVQIRAQDVSPGKIGSAVVLGIRQMSEELATGALLTIDPRRTRLKVLPFGTPR